jgi:glycosyltransferase involved in cell wall biosynthesis
LHHPRSAARRYNVPVNTVASPRVTIAITQRESFHHTFRSLDSLFASTRTRFELLYIDAGSPPWIARRLKRLASEHSFRLVREDRYLTPNQSRNIALQHCTTEYIVFVDNDVLFREAWLERLVACADETHAAIAGPLICIGDPPFRRVHIAGGLADVHEGERGRRFHEVHRFVDLPYVDVVSQLQREPIEMVEFHCMLVRRSLFDAVGLLDEKLSSASEHMDLCMLARRAGAKVYFEPSAVVNQLLPPAFPADLPSLPFFLRRWSEQRNVESVAHFRDKWNIDPDDHALRETLTWLNGRRSLVFKPILRPVHGARLRIKRTLDRVTR